MRFLYFIPIGKIEKRILEKLSKDLVKVFGLSVRIAAPIDVPDWSFNKLRNQYQGEKILSELNRLEFFEAEKILGISQVDLYADDLNFIFGQAEAPGKAALISMFRLRPKPSKKKLNNNLFYHRILKEAVHELGHTFSLSHCPDPRCVMHFSNNISDTDYKREKFCAKCEKLYQMRVK